MDSKEKEQWAELFSQLKELTKIGKIWWKKERLANGYLFTIKVSKLYTLKLTTSQLEVKDKQQSQFCRNPDLCSDLINAIYQQRSESAMNTLHHLNSLLKRKAI